MNELKAHNDALLQPLLCAMLSKYALYRHVQQAYDAMFRYTHTHTQHI